MPLLQVASAKRTNMFEGFTRIRFTAACIVGVAVLMGVRLSWIMLVSHEFFVLQVENEQERTAMIFPKRGQIFVQDSRTKEEYPLALNRDTFTVYADTREIQDEAAANNIAGELAQVFSYTDEKKFSVYLSLRKINDPYEPIEQRVSEDVVSALRQKALPGIGFERHAERFYPEGPLAAHVVGFVGKTESGDPVGRYGVEGYWQETLLGKGGFEAGAMSASGRWIPLAGRTFRPVEDGADVLLTIDRTVQHIACERLRKAKEEYGAVRASVIIMDPFSGAIRAMCSLPDFDPNTYSKVETVEVYNNSTIFTPYEPGSIMKPLIMAGAIEEGVVTPETPFFDSGKREGVCDRPIQNAGVKSYGDQTMVGVLQNSINTGMVFVAEKLGRERVKKYVERFGFGVRHGIALDTEAAGTIESLSRGKKDDLDCYTATASFGQGLTVTPLQMVAAYSAIANGGLLVRPYVVEEVRHANGQVERTMPTEVHRVLSDRAASLVSGMLVNVVDAGQAKDARVPGYYVAGKTGTAQIAGRGGYIEDVYNHSFAGFAPVDRPMFAMLVFFEKPDRTYSASTAAPVFADIASFLLQYYRIPPER